VIDLLTLPLGDHTLTVYAMDMAWNQSSASVTFTIGASVDSLMAALQRLYDEGQIDNHGIFNSLMKKLAGAAAARQDMVKINKLEAFINEVMAQTGLHITPEAAEILIADAQWVIANLP